MNDMLWTVILSAGIPSAIVGFFFSRLNRKIDKRDKEKEDKEKAHQKNEVMMVELIMASLSLGEATAEAVQRIPDANCNGDMHEALSQTKEVKKKYRDFEREQTAKSIN